MKNIKLILAITLFTLAFNYTLTAKTICTTPTESEVSALFDRWNESLQTLNPELVVENYFPESVLHPTLQDQMVVDKAGKIAYFTKFLQKKPVGKIIERQIFTGCNYAVDTGIYEFTLTSAEGVTSVAKARYTFTYKLENGKWLITSHTSALSPEEIA